jgi:glycerol-3-phosphate dehydrogenase
VRAAQVFWAVRHEMARSVDDVLSRRVRVLSIDARAAIRMAPAVARVMAGELGRDERWQAGQVAEFTSIAERYLPR